MAASYPGSVRSFSTKQDFVTPILAADPNSIQEEVIAIEQTLGVQPTLSTANLSTGSYSNSAITYATLTARLANIEQGIVADTHTQYMKRAGNETMTNGVASNVALVIQGAASQTADLLQFKGNSGTVIASVSSGGAGTFAKLTAPEVQNGQVLGIFGS